VNVRELVTLLETAVINLLAELDIVANGDPQARGVYVDGCKIAAMGLRVSRGRSYHGLSLNADMNLAPFSGINPCGYEDLTVTSIAELLGDRCPPIEAVGALLVRHLQDVLPSPT
jgi:lipoyl(octanoyl) transferase